MRGKIDIAEGMVESAVAQRYALPLPYHRYNTLTFASTGTGVGTMSVVINGTTYDLAITDSLSAADAADLFRTAAVDSDDFIVGSAGTNLAEVIIISNTDSGTLSTANDEVNITAAPDTNGITAAIGTRADRYPRIIEQITAELATALLLMDNYGVEAQDTPKDGEKRMLSAEVLLQRIQGVDEESGLTICIFDEVTKVEITGGSSDIPAFSPNDTTKVDDDDPTAAKVGINDVW